MPIRNTEKAKKERARQRRITRHYLSEGPSIDNFINAASAFYKSLPFVTTASTVNPHMNMGTAPVDATPIRSTEAIETFKKYSDLYKALNNRKATELYSSKKINTDLNYDVDLSKFDFSNITTKVKDEFVDFLSSVTGKQVTRKPITSVRNGDVYTDGYSYFDNAGTEIAHIGGTRTGNNVFVESSYVNPAYRRKGIGKRMYFDFNNNVYNRFGTTLHSNPFQHQFTLESSPGSGVLISPSSKLWQGLKKDGLATTKGKGFNWDYVMAEPTVINNFYKRSLENAGNK